MESLIVYGDTFDANSKQLYAACKKRFDKAKLARIADISAYVGSHENLFWLGDKQLPHIDVCFVRSFGRGSYEQITKRMSMMEHLELSGIFSVNPTEAYRKAKDKYSMTCFLANAGLPVPRTYITEMANWAHKKSKEFEGTVYKPIVGSMGFGSMKFDDVDLAFNAYKTLERIGQPMYLQEYLKKPGRDIRTMVMGEMVLASIYREATLGQWKTNVAQGAAVQSISLSPELQEMAIKAAKTFGLLYAGVDILESNQGAFVLEVNSSPSWQGLQRASGIRIADKLVEFVAEHLKK
jgi:ribosomal protein S6--L-glutamate ligase